MSTSTVPLTGLASTATYLQHERAEFLLQEASEIT